MQQHFQSPYGDQQTQPGPQPVPQPIPQVPYHQSMTPPPYGQQPFPAPAYIIQVNQT
jgi:hypothetical protein